MNDAPFNAPPACSDQPLWDVWLSVFHAPALAIADELGLFVQLRENPATAEQLAERTAVEARAVTAFAGLLTSLGFLARWDGRFHLTETARTYLLPESPYYWGGMLRRILEISPDFRRIADSLRRGTARTDAHVSSVWEVPEPPPERLRSFTRAMHAHSFSLAMRAVPTMGLSGVRRFLDVGGGSGSFSIAAALHHPGLRATVMDLPVVCELAREYAAKHGLGESVDVVATNMFTQAWPRGYDAVFFSDVFHDWDDARCRLLARRAFEALPSGGEILVHELLLSDGGDGPLAAAAYSIAMVFATQGRQRTAAELADIVSDAGFTDVRLSPTSGGFGLIRARRP